MTPQDRILEDKINAAHHELTQAITRDDTIAALSIQDKYFDLIKQRSPERVAEMELEKGLR